jgi:hypothetical protein
MTTTSAFAREGRDYWLSIMIGAAPEREDEIRRLWSKYDPRVRITNDKTCSISASRRGLSIDIRTPEVYWLISFAAWEAIELYGALVTYSVMSGVRIADVLRHDSNLPQMELDYRARLRAAIQYRDARDINLVCWPPDIPRPSGDRYAIEGAQYSASFDLACSALGFILFHEFYHIVLIHENQCPPDRREEEMHCDAWARSFLTARIEEYANSRRLDYSQVLERRSMAAVISSLIIYEITPGWGHGGTSEYFAVRDRITALLCNTPLPSGSHFWNFAAAVLIGICRSRNIPFEAPPMNEKALAEHLITLL